MKQASPISSTGCASTSIDSAQKATVKKAMNESAEPPPPLLLFLSSQIKGEICILGVQGLLTQLLL